MLIYVSLVNCNPPDIIAYINKHKTGPDDIVALDFYFVVREQLLNMVDEIVGLIESETGLQEVRILNHPLNGLLHHSRYKKWKEGD